MFVDKELQKLEAPVVDVGPALSLFALVLANGEVGFVGFLLPDAQGFAFEDAAAALPEEAGQGGTGILEMLGLGFYVVEGGNGAAQIGDVDVVEMAFLVVEVGAYFLSLLVAEGREGAGLVSADNTFVVVLGLAVPGEEQSDSCKLVFHQKY